MRKCKCGRTIKGTYDQCFICHKREMRTYNKTNEELEEEVQSLRITIDKQFQTIKKLEEELKIYKPKEVDKYDNLPF